MASTTLSERADWSDSSDDMLAQVPNAVALVTFLNESGHRVGTLLSGLVKLSSHPARLVLVGPEATVHGDQIRQAGTCWVSLLAEDQSDLVEAFTGASEVDPEVVRWEVERGLPAIPANTVGWSECRVDEVLSVSESFVAFVTQTTSHLERDTRPMVGFQGGFGGFLPTSLTAAARPGMEDPLHIARIAQVPIELLAQELGAECSVIGYADGNLVALAVANYSPTARVTQIGELFPVIPPVGVLFVDSSETGLTEEFWLSQVSLAGSGGHSEWVALARAQLARAKERGWSIMLDGTYSPRDLDKVVEAASTSQHTRTPPPELVQSIRQMMTSFEPENISDTDFYDVHTLSVPVRAAESGQTIVMLRLAGTPLQASGAEVQLWLSLLEQTARSIEAEI